MTYHRNAAAAALGAFPPDIGGEMDVDPRSHAASIAGGRLVPTVWAQRALNAAGIRTIVDGLAGPATLAGLRNYWTNMRGTKGPEPALQSGTSSWVFISQGMEANMSLLRRVADPSGSTVAASSWTTPASQPRPATTSTPTSTSIEPSASDGGKLLPGPATEVSASMDPTPWIVGGAVALAGLVAVGLLASRRKKQPKPNRRRR